MGSLCCSILLHGRDGAASIASLVETALRFLDTYHAIQLFETVDGGGRGMEIAGGEEGTSRVMERTMESVGSAFGDIVAADLLGSPGRIGS